MSPSLIAYGVGLQPMALEFRTERQIEMIRRLRPTPIRRRDVTELDAEDEGGGAPLDLPDHSFVLEPLRRDIQVVILGIIYSIARPDFPAGRRSHQKLSPSSIGPNRHAI